MENDSLLHLIVWPPISNFSMLRTKYFYINDISDLKIWNAKILLQLQAYQHLLLHEHPTESSTKVANVCVCVCVCGCSQHLSSNPKLNAPLLEPCKEHIPPALCFFWSLVAMGIYLE